MRWIAVSLLFLGLVVPGIQATPAPVPADLRLQVLSGKLAPLDYDDVDKRVRYISLVIVQETPESIVGLLKALDNRLGNYNPVIDLLDPAQRPLLQAVLAWKPALATVRDLSPPHFPSPYPFSLAVARDDVEACRLLLANGASPNNDEDVGEDDWYGLPAPTTSFTWAKSDAMKSFLRSAGATEFLEVQQKGVSTDNRVRIRKAPIDGDTLGYLSKGDLVGISHVSALHSTINGHEAPWYHVTTQALTGWVWGGFLAQDRTKPPARDDGKDAPLPQYLGTWKAEGLKGTTFQLTFQQQDGWFVGYHEAVWGNGSRVDEAALGQGPPSMSFTEAGERAGKVQFTSGYNPDVTGHATITLRPDGKIEWKVTDQTAGEAYLPPLAVLVRVK